MIVSLGREAEGVDVELAVVLHELHQVERRQVAAVSLMKLNSEQLWTTRPFATKWLVACSVRSKTFSSPSGVIDATAVRSAHRGRCRRSGSGAASSADFGLSGAKPISRSKAQSRRPRDPERVHLANGVELHAALAVRHERLELAAAAVLVQLRLDAEGEQQALHLNEQLEGRRVETDVLRSCRPSSTTVPSAVNRPRRKAASDARSSW